MFQTIQQILKYMEHVHTCASISRSQTNSQRGPNIKGLAKCLSQSVPIFCEAIKGCRPPNQNASTLSLGNRIHIISLASPLLKLADLSYLSQNIMIWIPMQWSNSSCWAKPNISLIYSSPYLCIFWIPLRRKEK